jgi:hypothetical protein
VQNNQGLRAEETFKLKSIMKTKLLIGSLATMALLVAGCETDGLSVREQHNNYAAMINSIYRQPVARATNQPLVAPLQLAVAQIGEVSPDTSLVTELAKNPALIQRIVPLPLAGDRENYDRYNRGPEQTTNLDELASEVESLRNLSRDAGAGYLLVVGGSIDSYDSHNPLAALDFTILGAAVLPSDTIKADGKAGGALIDVETGRVLFLTEAQMQKSGMTATFYSEDRRQALNNELRGDLLKQLADNFVTNLNQQGQSAK